MISLWLPLLQYQQRSSGGGLACLGVGVLPIWLVCIVVAFLIGHSKDRGGDGLVLGILLGPIGVLLILIGGKSGTACPYCREVINAQAQRCAKCQSWLWPGWSQGAPHPQQQPPPPSQQPPPGSPPGWGG